MHLVSTLNPLSKSDGNVPVALFVFEDQRKFLRISENYKDTIYAIGRAFNIDDDDLSMISLSTSSLDICKGRDVVIDGDAYPLMWKVLDEINVKVDGSLMGAVESEEPSRPTLNAVPHVPASTPIPEPSQQQPHTLQRGSTSINQTRNVPVDDNNTTDEPTPVNPRPTAGKRMEESGHSKVLGVPVPLPHRKPDEQQPVIEEPSKDAKDSWKLVFKKPDTSTPNVNPPVLLITPKKNVTQPNNFPLKQGTLQLVPKAEKGRTDKVSSNSSDESPAEHTPTNHRSPHKEQPEPMPQTQLPITDDADPRFEITIVGPEPNQSACFKTRGKHPVRKVLQAACRTFGVDYNLSHLMLAVTLEDEGRELTHRFECAVDDTVTMCGINSESRLFLRVDGSGSNDYE